MILRLAPRLLLLLLLGASASAQITVFVNQTGNELRFAFRPDHGTWSVGGNATLHARHSAISNPEIREFVLPRNQVLRLACLECSGFIVLSGPRLSGSTRFLAGNTYTFIGIRPLYEVRVSSTPAATQALDVDATGFWDAFTFNRDLPPSVCPAAGEPYDPPSGSVEVTLQKTSGIWLVDKRALADEYITLQLPKGVTRVLCADCRSVSVLQVAHEPAQVTLQKDTAYQIEQRNKIFSVAEDKCLRVQVPDLCGTEDSPFGQLPSAPCPLAPPGAGGAVYIVNGQPNPLTFSLRERGQAIITNLLGREGRTFFCSTECVASIGTGSVTIQRTVQPGKSYAIVLTPQQIYDLRVYSQ